MTPLETAMKALEFYADFQNYRHGQKTEGSKITLWPPLVHSDQGKLAREAIEAVKAATDLPVEELTFGDEKPKDERRVWKHKTGNRIIIDDGKCSYSTFHHGTPTNYEWSKLISDSSTTYELMGYFNGENTPEGISALSILDEQLKGATK